MIGALYLKQQNQLKSPTCSSLGPSFFRIQAFPWPCAKPKMTNLAISYHVLFLSFSVFQNFWRVTSLCYCPGAKGPCLKRCNVLPCMQISKATKRRWYKEVKTKTCNSIYSTRKSAKRWERRHCNKSTLDFEKSYRVLKTVRTNSSSLIWPAKCDLEKLRPGLNVELFIRRIKL